MNRTVTVIRKPFSGTVAQNVLEHGVGGINVDVCRIVTSDTVSRSGGLRLGHEGYQRPGRSSFTHKIDYQMSESGRWPANFLLDESSVLVMDEMSGMLSSPKTYTRAADGFGILYNGCGQTSGTVCTGFGDSGGASRFFYIINRDE